MGSSCGKRRIPRGEGRRLFGLDVDNYDSSRPEYPAAVYEILQKRCGLGPGVRTLEIGAGSGLATRELIARGANPIVAVEPDPALAERLRATVNSGGAGVEIHVETFEDLDLPGDSFDLAIAATSFHWIEPETGLARVRRVLRPGGAWAMWWNVFGDPERDDAFHEATHGLFESLRDSPSAGADAKPPFALDVEARIAELSAAGFVEIDHEIMRWSLFLDPGAIRSLYGTFSSIIRLPHTERERVLDAIAKIAATEFDGAIERNMVTSMYTARRPGNG